MNSEAGGLNVLVADDNPSARAQVVAILEELGHETVAVGDGDEAVSALSAIAFDLVVLDFRMPGTGSAVIAAEHGARVAVIGLSSAGAERGEWGNAPLVGWLSKPVDARELALILRRLAEDGGAGDAPEAAVDLAHLTTYTGGNRDLERELAVLFGASCERYLGEMAVAADDRAWREAAHGLKGAAQGIGANEVGRMAAFAETLAGEAGEARRPVILEQLRDAADRVHIFFENHLGSSAR